MNRDEAELIELYYNIIGACVEQICLATVRFSMIVNVKSVNSYLTVLYNMLQLQCCHIFTTPNINQDGRVQIVFVLININMITRGNLSRPRAFSVTSSLNKIIFDFIVLVTYKSAPPSKFPQSAHTHINIGKQFFFLG